MATDNEIVALKAAGHGKLIAEATPFLQSCTDEIAARWERSDFRLGAGRPYEREKSKVDDKFLRVAFDLTVPRAGWLGRQGFRRKVAQVVVFGDVNHEIVGCSVRRPALMPAWMTGGKEPKALFHVSARHESPKKEFVTQFNHRVYAGKLKL